MFFYVNQLTDVSDQLYLSKVFELNSIYNNPT